MTDLKAPNTRGTRNQVGALGVDSGQMGISSDLDLWDDGLYSEICDVHDGEGGMFRNGVVSSTGYGDGFYVVSTVTRAGDAVGVEVDFGVEGRTEPRTLGVVKVEGGVLVGDPCYGHLFGANPPYEPKCSRDELRTHVALPDGAYVGLVQVVDAGEWGPRVGTLGIYRAD